MAAKVGTWVPLHVVYTCWKTLHLLSCHHRAAQVHPVVSRLCSPIEGTDAARLADCLGLDAAKFRSAPAGDTSVRDALEEAQLASTATLDCDARYKVRVHGLAAPGLPLNSPAVIATLASDSRYKVRVRACLLPGSLSNPLLSVPPSTPTPDTRCECTHGH
jgi:hypothetical protein